MNFEKKLYSISQAAELIGVSADTLRRWEEEGLYQPVRTSGGQRRYDVSSLKKLRPLTRRFRGRKNLPSKDEVQFLIPAVSPATSSDLFHRPIYLNRKYLSLASVVMVWFIAFGFAFGRTEVGKKFFGETGSILKSLFNSEEAMRRIAKQEIGWDENKKLGKILGNQFLPVASNELPVASYSPNLLKNFSFETKGTVESLAFWQLHPNSTNDNTQMSNHTAHSGSYSLLVTADIGGVIQESTKTETGKSYQLGVWVKTESATRNSLPATRQNIHLALGPGYDKSFSIDSRLRGNDNWKYYSTSFSSPPPGLVPRIYVSGNTGGFVFLDDVSLVEVESIANSGDNSYNGYKDHNTSGAYLASAYSLLSTFSSLLPTGGNVMSISSQGIFYPTDSTQTQGGLGIESSRIGKMWGSNIDISQSLSVNEKVDIAGKLTANGSITLGNNDGDEIEVGGRFISDLLPKQSNAISIGTSTQRWNNLFTATGNISNNLTVGGATTITGLLTVNGGLSASGGSGLSVTGDLALDGDLDFQGPQNITTTSDNLTISPTGNLIIDTSSGSVIVRDASIDLTGQNTTISAASLVISANGSTTLTTGGTLTLDSSTSNTDLRLQGGLGELRGDYGTIVLAAKNSLTLDTSQNNTNLLVQTGSGDFNVNSGQLIIDGNGSLTLAPSNGQVTITGNTDVSNGLDVTNGFTVNGTSSLGDGGTTNYLAISNTGDLTMNGTSNNLIANNDLVIRSAQSLTLDTSANNTNLLVRTGSGTFDVSVGSYTLTTSSYTQTTNGSTTITQTGNINRTVAGNITDRITGANNYVLRVGDAAAESTTNGNDIWLAAEDRIDLRASGLTLSTSSTSAGELRLTSSGSLTLDTSANNTNLLLQGGTGGLTGNYGTMALTSTTDSSNSISISAARGGITLSTSNASGNGNLSLYSAGTLTLDTSSKNSNLRLQTGSGTLSASLGTAIISTETGPISLISRSSPFSLITESTANGPMYLSSTGTLTLDTSRTGANIFIQGGLARIGSGEL